MAIEQRHRAGVDLSGASPGARRVLRQSLEDRTLDAGADQRVGGQQTRGTGTDDPDVDAHAIATLSHRRGFSESSTSPDSAATTDRRHMKLLLEIDHCAGQVV